MHISCNVVVNNIICRPIISCIASRSQKWPPSELQTREITAIITTRKEGFFRHQKDTKLTLFKDHDTCHGSYNHCEEGVILDKSYFLANGIPKSCRDLVSTDFNLDGKKFIMDKFQR